MSNADQTPADVAALKATSHAAPVTTTGIIAWAKQEEPVAVAFAVMWLLGQLGAFLIGHKIFGTQQWTTLVNQLAPSAITGVTLVLGYLARRVTFSPKTVASIKSDAATALSLATKVGILNDADISRIESLLKNIIGPKLTQIVGTVAASGGGGGSAAQAPFPLASAPPPAPTAIPVPIAPPVLPAPAPSNPIFPAGFSVPDSQPAAVNPNQP